MSLPPHAAAIESVARGLGSDPASGLSEHEAEARLARYGPNRPRRLKGPPYLEIAARQLVDPLVGLLVAAAAVSATIGDGIEATAIGAIVVLNATLGFVQEARAERAVRALREELGGRASVMREGREREIPAEEVVPGDLLVLREGDRVVADGRLVAERGLAVDESILTGESVPAEKATDPVPVPSPLGDRLSMVFAGTWVTRGRGSALVTAVADATEEGRIVGLTASAKPPETPLQRRLRGLTRQMVAAGVAVTLVIGAGMFLRDASLHEAFLVGVSVAVAAVPEGLAATLTIALALGAHAMAARGAIVRRLAAVETLGETTVVCTDKTGTLTENRLRVSAAVPEPGTSVATLLSAAVLASSAELVEEETEGRAGGTRVAGDPLEGALLVAAREQGLSAPALRAGLRVVHEIPFDPVRKRMAVVYEEADGGLWVAVKGAPEVLIERSALPEPERLRLAELAHALAEQGSRVLALGERRLPAGSDPEAEGVDADLVLLGLVALHDPLRPEAEASVREARAGGIEVRMLTGDHPATARAVGRALGLHDEAVLARVSPSDKLEIVEALQREGEVVAVTGDGINDAPALRRADVGVAMGRSGTEAAREASALVLANDDFSTIVAAVHEGRRIADNLRTFVAFLLSANLGEVVLFAVAVLGGLGVPMTVVQVLTINVLTDGLPAVAVSRDPEAPDAMARGPRRSGVLFTRAQWGALGAIGLLVGVAGLGAYLAGRALGGGVAQTMAFATVALAELALVFSLRARLEPAWRAGWNPLLVGGVAVSAGFTALVLYAPALHGVFATVSLSAGQLGVVVALALSPAVLVELGKATVRRSAYDSARERGAAV